MPDGGTMENPQLELADRFIGETAVNLFLTGRAGTGKTTFLHRLRERSPKRMIVVAPTGVAAINAGGVTIHSFFKLAFAPYIPESVRGVNPQNRQEQFRFNKQKIAIIRSIDLLVIDEISMVRADVLDAVSDVLRRYRDPGKPFGGVQLLLIGDLQQLAPVVRDEEWSLLGRFYASPFFFESRALKETSYVCIELQHIYRQSDERFITMLNAVRESRVDPAMLEELNRRYRPAFDPDEKDGYITLTSHNHTAHGINEAKMAALPGASCTYQAALEGTFPEYLYPTDASLTLKAGAQVMFIKNDPSPEKRYYNGKIGIVTGLDDGSVEVLPHGAAEPIAVEPAEWLNTKYKIDPETKELTEEVEGRFVQYPLKAAWAITIHKSQGLTFERAVIDAADSFSHGQVYVALSRCKSLEGLVLRAPLDARCMICDPTVRAFTDYAAEHRPDGALLARQAEAYYRRLLLELFDFAAVGKRLRILRRFVDEHLGSLYPKLSAMWQQHTVRFSTEISDVGIRFQKQIDRMIGGSAGYRDDPRLAERVGKGRDYFLARCGEIIDPLLAACDVEIDSKELRKDFAKMLSAAGDQVRIKKAVLEATADGFDLYRYLEAKAKASLEESRSSVGAEAKVTVSDDVLHPALFETLRSWRKEEAGRQKVPVYVVMSQKALLGVSNLLPSSLRELARIKGVGDKFLEKYGDTVLEFVREFRAETGADMDFPTPEVAVRPDAGGTKPKRKEREDTRLVTLGLLEEGLTRREIAAERGLSAATIDGHIADLIRRGALEADRFVPEDKIRAITRCLNEHPGEKFALIQENLGSDYSYSEIRFVHSALERGE